MKRILWLLLLFPLWCSAQTYNSFQENVFTTTGSGKAIFQNTTSTYHQLSWTRIGTVTTCTVAVDSSVDGSSWSAGGIITGQDCSIGSASAIVNAAAKYVRVTLTVLTGGGSIDVVYKGWPVNPAGGGVGGVSSVGLALPASLFNVSGS